MVGIRVILTLHFKGGGRCDVGLGMRGRDNYKRVRQYILRSDGWELRSLQNQPGGYRVSIRWVMGVVGAVDPDLQIRLTQFPNSMNLREGVGGF
jgi:hypothetical protein